MLRRSRAAAPGREPEVDEWCTGPGTYSAVAAEGQDPGREGKVSQKRVGPPADSPGGQQSPWRSGRSAISIAIFWNAKTFQRVSAARPPGGGRAHPPTGSLCAEPGRWTTPG